MPIAGLLIFGLGLWLFSEIFVFGLVAAWIGLGSAILATLLTSLLGLVFLRRLGRSARDELRSVLAGGALVRLAPEAVHSGVLAALGGILLLLPGFLSDCVGLALQIPALRRRAPAPPIAPVKREVIDLSPQDWQHIDENRG